jgi:hypothetical protein
MGYLDKEATSHDDLFDAFRMSLIFCTLVEGIPKKQIKEDKNQHSEAK